MALADLAAIHRYAYSSRKPTASKQNQNPSDLFSILVVLHDYVLPLAFNTSSTEDYVLLLVLRLSRAS